MGILSGNPKDEPLHYGEVYGLWQSLNGTGMMKSALEVYINHTGDDDLKEFLHDKLQLAKDHMMELTELLKENGIPMPPVPPEVPNANLEDIPPGARIIDPAIAASVAKSIAAGQVASSQMMGQCIREDVAALHDKYHSESAAYGLRLLRIQKEKGWLIPPPLQVKHTEHVE